jgi:hypothetical protein
MLLITGRIGRSGLCHFSCTFSTGSLGLLCTDFLNFCYQLTCRIDVMSVELALVLFYRIFGQCRKLVISQKKTMKPTTIINSCTCIMRLELMHCGSKMAVILGFGCSTTTCLK